MEHIFDIYFMLEAIPKMLLYLPTTLVITLVSVLLGNLFGLIIAVIKIKQLKIISPICSFMVSFIRGTPLLIQLYLSYYGIPLLLLYINHIFASDLNVNNVPSLLFVLVAFSINEAAYSSETIRSAIQSVGRGQIEAAISLGMSYAQVLRRIILPEAIVNMLPNLGNNLIQLLKGTSLAFVCAVVEMTAQGKILAGMNYRYFEVYIGLALIYWALTILIEHFVKYLERKSAIPEQPTKVDYKI